VSDAVDFIGESRRHTWTSPKRKGGFTMEHAHDAQRRALARWDEDGGREPSAQGSRDEAGRDAAAHRASTRATFDAAHDSSARGEHRYPDTHQTDAEREARDDRDDLKRKLAGR
jgi:hypothetical protein